MNVSLSIFWRLDLDDKIDVGNVDTSRGDICGDEHAELAVFEALESDLTLRLGDVAVHHLDIRLDLVAEEQRVRVSLCLREDNRPATLAIDCQHISQC